MADNNWTEAHEDAELYNKYKKRVKRSESLRNDINYKKFYEDGNKRLDSLRSRADEILEYDKDKDKNAAYLTKLKRELCKCADAITENLDVINLYGVRFGVTTREDFHKAVKKLASLLDDIEVAMVKLTLDDPDDDVIEF